MKLVIVTAVEEFNKDIRKLFRKAEIENFSSSDIDGFKTMPAVFKAASWVTGERSGADSNMFFSFTAPDKIDILFDLIEEFNKNIETNNPIRAIVVPIEKFI
ncbi:hypothetical protein [Robertkochia sediminum]|uniref:hypothetical protein n=1 Tax=Robertkochia sediminum TaxID=2785326 RepID=UPI0019342525|nr:hypothetical protein [Robertkochia sediminum]MBL7474092.1 hypothetical protein [Robertkochia sediminum]